MNERTELSTLTEYKSWADHTFYQAISQLPTEALNRDRPMLFRSILRLLNHIYSMDAVWKSHLLGIAHGETTRNPENPPPFEKLSLEQHSINQWYIDYANSISPSQQSEKVNFTFIGSGTDTASMTRFEIIQHVVNHGSYHRGHIEGVLYQMGIEPPTTDLTVYLRDTRK